jgi:filamentous hemagglutinin
VSASVGEATRLAAAAIVAAEAANAGSSAVRWAGEAVALDVARGLGGTAKGALTTTGFPEYGTTLWSLEYATSPWRVGTVSEIAAEMAAGYGGRVVPYVASSVAGSSGLVYALTEGLGGNGLAAKGGTAGAKLAGKDIPYGAQATRAELESLYGSRNVASTTVPPLDGRNVHLASQRHPVSGIVFDTRGFPIFDDVAAFDTRLASGQFRAASYEQQMQMASRDLSQAIQRGEISASRFTPDQLSQIQNGAAQINGYTWHHHQDYGRMQLVPRDIHRTTGHIGGEGISGGR